MSVEKEKKVWGIIGLGWLGQALADQLKLLGIDCWGTHRDSFDFENGHLPDKACDIVLLNTPPLLTMSASSYVEKVVVNSDSKIIFISSTSVYGLNTDEIDEQTAPLPVSSAAHWLLQVENLLQRKFKNRLIIVRPGGLIGGQRHPIFSLSKRGEISDSQQTINLIHRDDLIQIIILIADQLEFGIVNAVAPYHPTKENYYGEWVKKLNLKPFKFNSSSKPNRQISSIILPKLYKQWKYPNLDSI